MSQINRFYINKPSNFTELIVFKLYTFSLTKIFAKYDSKLNLTVIKDNSFTTDKEIKLLVKNISDLNKKSIILNFDNEVNINDIPKNQEKSFENYKDPSTITVTFLSNNYNVVSKFIYKITEYFIDLVKSFKNYMQYDNIFANKMNIMQQLTFKETKFITLNLDTYNNIVMPDMYYIKALAIIFNTLKLKENDIRNIKIIITYDDKINEKALKIFIKNIS